MPLHDQGYRLTQRLRDLRDLGESIGDAGQRIVDWLRRVREEDA